MRKLLWGLVVIGVVGCGTGAGTGGGDDDDGGTTPTPPPTETATPPPTPTPTPSGPVYLESLYTPDDSPRVAGGQCIGFTLVGNTATFGEDLTVDVGPWNLPVTVLDANHARVGEPATGGVCTWLPIFLTTSGTYAPTVTTMGETYVLDETPITVDKVDAIEVGLVMDVRVWEVGAFEKPFDTDVYRVNIDDTVRRYADMDFFPTGSVPIVPEMQFWQTSHPVEVGARGGVGLIFPQGGYNYLLVRDVNGVGGPGADYNLAFIGDVLGGAHPADDCAGAPYITPRAYHVDYDSLTDDFHPTCADSIYGNPIRGNGKDGVWKVAVPAHTELRVSSYDDHIDNVVFLLPIDGGCPHTPSTCTAAAGRFGGGATDTLVYDNDTDAAQEFYLVHDGANVYDYDPQHPEVVNPQVGAFLIDVELFPR